MRTVTERTAPAISTQGTQIIIIAWTGCIQLTGSIAARHRVNTAPSRGRNQLRNLIIEQTNPRARPSFADPSCNASPTLLQLLWKVRTITATQWRESPTDTPVCDTPVCCDTRVCSPFTALACPGSLPGMRTHAKFKPTHRPL